MKEWILVWNRKGGATKTTISALLSHYLEAPIITNEEDSPLYHIFPEKQLLTLSDDQAIPNAKGRVIFDFGGFKDPRIVQIAQVAKYIIVPTQPEAMDIQKCISTIQSLKKHTDKEKIIVIASKTEGKGDYESVKNAISQIGDYKVFEIKKSRALPNMFTKKKSIKEQMESSPLARYSYKKVSEQIDSIINYLI